MVRWGVKAGTLAEGRRRADNGRVARKWLLALLLLAIALFLINTDYGDRLRDTWVPTAILCLAAGAVIWDAVRRTLRERRELIATGEWWAGLYAPWRAHLVRICAFFGVPIAVNVALSASHGELWGWSSFSIGVFWGAVATLVYYWRRIRGIARPRSS
jgi:hypothetical protein